MPDIKRVYFYSGPAHGRIQNVVPKSYYEIALHEQVPITCPTPIKRSLYEKTIRKLFRIRDERMIASVAPLRSFAYRLEIIRRHLNPVFYLEAFVYVPESHEISGEQMKEIEILLDHHRLFSTEALPEFMPLPDPEITLN